MVQEQTKNTENKSVTHNEILYDILIEPKEIVIEKKVIVKVSKNIPDQKEFINYLNSLWNCDDENMRFLNDITEKKEIDIDILKKFKKNIEDRFENINIVGNFNYTNKLEKEVQLHKNDLKDEDLKLAYLGINDLIRYDSINNNTMNKINRVHISTKIKDTSKSPLDSKNYRFIQIHSKPIKLIDRLWCFKVHNIVKMLDTNIFKSNLLKEMNKNVVNIATENTLSRDNVVLIDIEKAFDSCDYKVVEELLIRSLSRKSNIDTATKITKQYIYIIRQRIIYYKENIITFKKGIPTGLPSSNIVFSILMDEIISEWLGDNNNIFKMDKDFIINIFVDDVYLKILNIELTDIIVRSLVDKFKKYKFNVNFDKCKADEKLKLQFFTNLEESDLYLGIPFTRDLRKYSKLILNLYNKKHNKNYTYEDIYNNVLIPKGFFNYKLKPLMKDDETTLTFIEKYLI
jgi:hypothetical protein